MKLASICFVALFSLGQATTDCCGSEPTYYIIRMNDEPIGSAETQSDDITWNGQQLRRIRSTTTLNVAVLGAKRRVVRRSETLVQPASGLPVFYQLKTDTNGTLRHIECAFKEGKTRTWNHADGEPKGVGAETSLPDKTRILGSNDFGHWALLMKAAESSVKGDKASLRVFLPDLQKTATFQFARGETKDISIAGKSRRCTQWELEGEGLSITVDARTGKFLRMDIPSQKTTVTISDKAAVKVADDAAPQEVLAQRFAQSNVLFDDFLNVRLMKVKLEVTTIGSGGANDRAVLTTAMQQFDGTKKQGEITGTITIASKPYQGEQSPTFPTEKPVDSKLAPWLEPSAMIESDDSAIITQAKELTEAAKMRWEAVLQIARWVHKQVSYKIADSPSARLALKTRKGDCGPHATLTVAMLRSLGIPAKLVGGVIYTPAFGGTFGQHAWVEVHMGPAGWVSLDPTTGEYERINATHIKLFEGMGGVVPKNIHVLDYQPPNRKHASLALKTDRPLPWKLGREYTYTYVADGTVLGTETFQIRQIKEHGKDVLEVLSKLQLKVKETPIKATTRLVVLANGLPVSYDRDFDAPGKKYTLSSRFKDNTASVSIQGIVNLKRDIELPPNTYCFDNNFIASFAVICGRLDLQEGKKIDVSTFLPSGMRNIPLTFQLKNVQKISVGTERIECFECAVAPIENTLWISRDGRLVKVEQGKLVIELQRSSK